MDWFQEMVARIGYRDWCHGLVLMIGFKNLVTRIGFMDWLQELV